MLDGGEIDVDKTAEAIGYPLNTSRRWAISERILRWAYMTVVWSRPSAWPTDSFVSDPLLRRMRAVTNSLQWDFIGELAKSLGARERPLSWRRIVSPDDTRPDASWIAAGAPLPGVDGFRRSHGQALAARAVVIASGSHPPVVTAASDPGLVVAAQFCTDLEHVRAWVGDVLGLLASATDSDETNA